MARLGRASELADVGPGQQCLRACRARRRSSRRVVGKRRGQRRRPRRARPLTARLSGGRSMRRTAMPSSRRSVQTPSGMTSPVDEVVTRSSTSWGVRTAPRRRSGGTRRTAGRAPTPRSRGDLGEDRPPVGERRSAPPAPARRPRPRWRAAGSTSKGALQALRPGPGRRRARRAHSGSVKTAQVARYRAALPHRGRDHRDRRDRGAPEVGVVGGRSGHHEVTAPGFGRRSRCASHSWNDGWVQAESSPVGSACSAHRRRARPPPPRSGR